MSTVDPNLFYMLLPSKKSINCHPAYKQLLLHQHLTYLSLSSWIWYWTKLAGRMSDRFVHDPSDCCTKHRHTSEPMLDTPAWDHLPWQLYPQRGSKIWWPEDSHQDCDSTRAVWLQFCFFEASLFMLHTVFSSKSAVTSLSVSNSPSRWRDLPIFFLQALTQADLTFLPKSLSSDKASLLKRQVSTAECTLWPVCLTVPGEEAWPHTLSDTSTTFRMGPYSPLGTSCHVIRNSWSLLGSLEALFIKQKHRLSRQSSGTRTNQQKEYYALALSVGNSTSCSVRAFSWIREWGKRADQHGLWVVSKYMLSQLTSLGCFRDSFLLRLCW